MADFKTIETQEELDSILKARLDRNTKTTTAEVEKKYEGWLSPEAAAKQTADLQKELETLRTQIAEKDTSIKDLTAKNTAYETASVKARIARECGIPAELADRLSGTNEEEYKADAEKLAKFVTGKPPAPLFNGDGGNMSGVEKAFYSKNPDLRKE